MTQKRSGGREVKVDLFCAIIYALRLIKPQTLKIAQIKSCDASYVVSIGTAAGLLYLYNIGYNHWLYNPLLYRLWTYPDLTSSQILTQRLYVLALAAAFLALAHLFFARKSR